jgi:hypothetical protein
MRLNEIRAFVGGARTGESAGRGRAEVTRFIAFHGATRRIMEREYAVHSIAVCKRLDGTSSEQIYRLRGTVAYHKRNGW